MTAAHYWHSALPTSKLRTPIQVGGGDIGVYYLREPVRGVRLSVGLMIIMRVRRLLRMRRILCYTYVCPFFFFLFFSPSDG